jgi:predicted O-methyltransferase YrrM
MIMPSLSKIARAVRLPSEALYSLYFDVFRPDPRGLAKNAREKVRSVYFETHGNRRIPTVALGEWLAGLADPPGNRCGNITLPVGLQETGGVGSMGYFYVLAAICSAVKPKGIVEFGTFLGAGTLTMALNCEAQILTIDLPDETTWNNVDTLNEVDRGLVAHRKHQTGSLYGSHPVRSRITELRCDSRSVDLGEHLSSVDLCLIDGGHSLECVRADTENALRVLSPGGIILWDDYFWLYPDVVSYVEEFSRVHAGTVRIRDTCLTAWRS